MNTILNSQQVDVWRAKFERDGFVVLPGYFSSEAVNSLVAAMDRAVISREMEIVVENMETRELTLYGLAKKKARAGAAFKFNDLYLLLEEVRAIALETGLSELLRALLGGKPPALCNSLTLERGSGQFLHIDSLFMTPYTPGDLCATWMALEDVAQEAGPLEYYPGSHRIPLYHFKDGSRHANTEEFPDWTAYITRELENRSLTKQTFLARKGDVLIWHSDLVHSGSEIQDKTKTRRSLVCHYSTEPDCRRIQEWKLVPLNDGFWVERPRSVVRPSPEDFKDADSFPEGQYLLRNPDLRAAVANGQIGSGFEHYCHYGYAEGRGI